MNIELQLERLKRHYEASVNFYDPISLLDLASTLRVWTEMKNSVDTLGKKFPISIRTKSVRNLLRRADSIYCVFGSGLTIPMTATKEVFEKNICYGPQSDKFSIGVLTKVEMVGSISIGQFLYIHRTFTEEEIQVMDYESKNVPFEKVSYSKFMESPFVYFRFKDNGGAGSITNEEIVKRIANEYEGSHASENGFVTKNIYSPPIKRMFDYGCVKLPLPYFQILYIAKTIIDVINQ